MLIMEKSNTRILHITRNMPPLVGGMERLNWHLADELSRKFDVYIIASEEARYEAPPNVQFSGSPLKPLWLFIINSLIASIKVARKFRPNTIIAGSGLTAPTAFIVAKIFNASSVAYVHGLDITIDNTIYRWIWLPFIRRMDKVIANSSYTAKLAVKIGIPVEFITVIPPGVELKTQPSNAAETEEFLSKYDLKDRKILLSVGRLAERKGLREFVKYSLPQIIEQESQAILVVIGEEPTNSLASKSQKVQDILEEADKQGLSDHLRFLGKVDNRTLSQAYEAASVHVFPVKHSDTDPEGFGMVAIEAAAHGTPTVAFATGGVIDAVSDGKTGFLIKNGDYIDFSKKVIQCIESKSAMKNDCVIYAENFSWPKFGQKLSTLISQWTTFD